MRSSGCVNSIRRSDTTRPRCEFDPTTRRRSTIGGRAGAGAEIRRGDRTFSSRVGDRSQTRRGERILGQSKPATAGAIRNAEVGGIKRGGPTAGLREGRTARGPNNAGAEQRGCRTTRPPSGANGLEAKGVQPRGCRIGALVLCVGWEKSIAGREIRFVGGKVDCRTGARRGGAGNATDRRPYV